MMNQSSPQADSVPPDDAERQRIVNELDRTMLVEAAAEKGAQWGDVIHGLLEAAAKQTDVNPEGLAVSLLVEEELPLNLLDKAITTVQKVVKSEIWQRAQASQRWLAEVPLALLLEDQTSPDGVPTLQRGVIDLVFLQHDGWVIVDYKSERVAETELPALVRYYQPQVEAYARAWAQVVEEPVCELGLFFTHTGRYERIGR